MKIVIDSDNSCGLCNKLWSLINPILWAKKHKKFLLILSYDYNYRYFPNLLINKNFFNPFIGIHHSIAFRLSHKIRLHLKNNRWKYEKSEKKIWNGWENIGDKINKKDLTVVRNIFKPCKKIDNRLEKIFSDNRKNNLLIIGIHIRRGDYKDYCDGKYFFSLEEYKKIMSKIIHKFGGGIKFFIASNEKIKTHEFSNFKFFTSNGSTVYDLYGLSKCDYIIGPPSTFSMWASLFGQVPICFIVKKNQQKFNFRNINCCPTLEEIEKI